MDKKLLIMMVGLPRSGKSTLARKIQAAHGHPIICPDDFRKEMYGHVFYKSGERHMWATVHSTIAAMFRSNDTVILDATNVTPEWRKTHYSPNWHHVCVWLDVPQDICMSRAGAADHELRAAISKMSGMFRPPGEDHEPVIRFDEWREPVSHVRVDNWMLNRVLLPAEMGPQAADAADTLATIRRIWAQGKAGSEAIGEGLHGYLADNGYMDKIEELIDP